MYPPQNHSHLTSRASWLERRHRRQRTVESGVVLLLALLFSAAAGVGQNHRQQAPAVSLSPLIVAFPTQVVGTSSLPKSVTLINTGNAVLNISSINIRGADPGDFTEVNNCGSSVVAGASCLIKVTFMPTKTGTRTAVVDVTDNAKGSPQHSNLTGMGSVPVPAVRLFPSTVVFAAQALGTTSPAQTVTLTNTGTLSLTITGITITGADSGDFSETNTCPGSLAAGGSCTASVTFRPANAGALTASLTVADNAVGSPQNAVLTGTGGAAPPPDPLGSVTGSQSIQCPPGGLAGTCTDLTISCPNIADSVSTIKVTSPVGTPVGTVIFIGGGGGSDGYEREYTFGKQEISTVVQAGYTAVQVMFNQSTAGWLQGPAADGPRAAACRPATAFQWIYQNVHQGGTTKPLCGTGNSGGGGALAYSLAHYGLGSIFSLVEPTSAPPFGRIDVGCLCAAPLLESICLTGVNNPCYGSQAALYIDPAYGDSDCSNRVASDAALWVTDSVGSPDATYSYPTTFVHALYGGQDLGPSPPLGLDWVNLISTQTSVECVLDAPHDMPNVLDAATKIASDITTGCVLQSKRPAGLH